MQSKVALLTIFVFLLTGLTVFLVWNDNRQTQIGLITSIAESEAVTSSYTPEPVSEPASQDQLAVDNYLTPSSEPGYFPIRDFNISDPEINAKAATLYDISKDKYLFRKNTDQHFPIASITKIMTAIIVIENMDLDEAVVVKVEDTNVDGDGADLYKDEKISVANLLKMLLINSSNDAALVLAGAANNKNIDFVLEMNKKALQLGMVNTKFFDPAGLNDDGFSTIFDLIKLVKYSQRYDIIWETTLIGAEDITSDDGLVVHKLNNTNKLLSKVEGIAGGKTGFTDGAGESMLLLFEHSGDLLLNIVLGSNDRFGETEMLIKWGKEAHKWN